mmetsp:Transcript_5628/g.34920  ORF Transcript_5628/g.34920 Transcript_5628/m.34920 type:complete len:206 (+) Transcript_5628:233-850(+)
MRCTRTAGHVLLLSELAHGRGGRRTDSVPPAIPLRLPTAPRRTTWSASHGKEVQESPWLCARAELASPAAKRMACGKSKRHRTRGRSDGMERRRRPSVALASRSGERRTEKKHGPRGHRVLPRRRKHGLGCRRSLAMVQKSRGRISPRQNERYEASGERKWILRRSTRSDGREIACPERKTRRQIASTSRAHAGIHALGWRRDQN